MHFLSQVGDFLTTSSNWTGPNGILIRLELQAELCVAVIGAAAVFGVGLGFYLGHVGKAGFIAVNSANAARAIPSLALLTLLAIQGFPGLLGGGFWTAFLTLVALGIPPILTNSYVGMREVDADLREAARAVGMSRWQRFWKVEAPLACPLAVAGLRTAAIEIVATSTLAAYVTYNDLGEYIFAGLAANDTVETFVGAVLVAALAGVTDLLILSLYRFFVPVGIRQSVTVRRGTSRGLARTFSHRRRLQRELGLGA